MRDEKPWADPAAGYADSGGVTGHRRWQTMGNHGTAKPEAKVRYGVVLRYVRSVTGPFASANCKERK